MIDGHHAVLFGGYHTGIGKSNDTFIIDLSTMVRCAIFDNDKCHSYPPYNCLIDRFFSLLCTFMQHWSQLDHQKGVSHPVERFFHVAVCLGYGGDNPKLLVTGGRGTNNVTLSDVWILGLDSRKWKEVRECDLLSDKAQYLT